MKNEYIITAKEASALSKESAENNVHVRAAFIYIKHHAEQGHTQCTWYASSNNKTEEIALLIRTLIAYGYRVVENGSSVYPGVEIYW